MPTSYIDEMLEQLDMAKCKPAATPGVDLLRLIESEELWSKDERKLHRRIVGQLLWLISIRPDIQFATPELFRGLVAPTKDHLVKMRTLLMYLAGTKPAVLQLRLHNGADLVYILHAHIRLMYIPLSVRYFQLWLLAVEVWFVRSVAIGFTSPRSPNKS